MKKYDLIIVTGESFPDGLAATNRIKCYASSIAKSKSVLFITISGPKYNVSEELQSSGTYRGVDYIYVGKASLNHKPGILGRTFGIIKRHVKLLKCLVCDYKASSLLISGRSLSLNVIARIITWIKGIPLYREISETPENIANPIKRKLQTQMCRMYDGIIVISAGIREYFKFIKDDAKFFLLPILVDIDQFSEYQEIPKTNSFFYCSGGNLERDGFIDSLNGFLIFAKDNPGYRLQVATHLNLSDPYHRNAKAIMDANSDVVDFLGRLSAFDIPYKLMSSLGLLVTPHKDYQTRGFPTKLGEYLASGTPVICSSIDSLAQQINADCVYFVKPNSPGKIAEKMLQIVSDSDYANAVGEKGREMVLNRYTMINYHEGLISFLLI